METKKLTIICITIIAIVLIVVGAVVFTSMDLKQESKIKVSSNRALYEGGCLTVKLTDSNSTPLVNEKVNLTITDKDGKEKVNKIITTNHKGSAKFKLNQTKGTYKVFVVFEGNGKYKPANATQKLTIKEKAKKAASSKPTYQKYSPQYGTYVNEYTDSNGVQHIDGANGVRVSYDPSTGIETYDDGHGHVDSMLMG